MSVCKDFRDIHNVAPNSDGCEECRKLGDEWVHLRLCLTCGNVACCDDSKNKHATKHFHQTHHPVIQSFQPDETWGWCYVHEIMVELEVRRVQTEHIHGERSIRP